MSDSVILTVSGQELARWRSFEVDADMYNAASAFAFDVANPDTLSVCEGQPVTLSINGTRVLKGYLDIVESSGSKGTRELKLYGRDMMGVLVDWQMTTGSDYDESGMKVFAEALLKNVPVINLKTVSYAKGVFDKQTIASLNPRWVEQGQSVFSVLSKFAKDHGLLFWCRPDGRFVFGTPLTTGTPSYTLNLRRDGKGNNIMRWTVRRDITKRFAKVIVSRPALAGKNNIILSAINSTFKDSEYPSAAVQKVCFLGTDAPTEDLAPIADGVLNEQRHAAFLAKYTVAGYGQNGKIWDINTICSVDDEINDIHGNYLVTGRTFSLSKRTGRTTEVRLGPLGAHV